MHLKRPLSKNYTVFFSDHFTFCLKCKRKCKDRLSQPSNLNDRTDEAHVFTNMYFYLMYAYYKGKISLPVPFPLYIHNGSPSLTHLIEKKICMHREGASNQKLRVSDRKSFIFVCSANQWPCQETLIFSIPLSKFLVWVSDPWRAVGADLAASWAWRCFQN